MSAAIAAQITTDAMKGVAENAISMMKFQQDERKQRADIANDIVRTAQDAKRLDIETFFNSEQLKLRAKALEIDALQNSSALLMDSANLGISRMNANANMMRARQAYDDTQKADGYKDYTNNLFKEAAVLEKDYKTNLDLINSDIEDLTVRLYGRKATADSEAIPGMSAIERFRDSKDPNGVYNRLQKRKSESKSDALIKKKERLDLLMKEAQAVSQGADPGVYIPYDKANSSSSSLTEPQMPFRDDGSFSINTGISGSGPDAGLFPTESISGGIRQLDNEIVKAQQDLKAYGGSDTMVGQEPSPQNYQATIPFKGEEEITREKDAEVMSYMLDKETSLDEIPAFINELSPKAKEDVASKKRVFESAFLLDYGIKKNYEFNTPYSSKDEASSHLSEKFIRHGGTQVDIVNVQNEAEQKLADLHVSAITSMPEAGEAEISKYIRSEYTKWVSSRNKTAAADASVKKDDAIKDGVIDPSGIVIASKSNQFNFDDIKKSLSTDPSGSSKTKLLEKEKSITSEFNQMLNKDGSLNRTQFFNIARQTGLAKIITGRSSYQIPISDDESVSEIPDRDLFDKINTMSKDEALLMWKKYKGASQDNSKPSGSIFENFAN